jgi:DNA-binding transcriptional MerR regulator
MSGRTIGAQLPPGHFTMIGLAKHTAIPVDTLRRWTVKGLLKPAYTKKYGKLTVKVFDAKAVQQAMYLRKNLKPGRNSRKNLSD